MNMPAKPGYKQSEVGVTLNAPDHQPGRRAGGESRPPSRKDGVPDMTDSDSDLPEHDVSAIMALAAQIQELSERAVVEYTPVVEAILRAGNRDVQLIERTLDGLLDFCGYDPAVELFRRLCRHYWDIDPVATAEYIQIYRKMWDPESLPESEESA